MSYIYRPLFTRVRNRLPVWLCCAALLAACNTDLGFGRSGNADLAFLTVTPVTLEPSFDEDETDYTARVAQNVSTVTFNATTDSEKASMTLDGRALPNDTDRTVTLELGRNVIKLKVTAENESTKTYEFVITRLEETSDNAFLDVLQLQDASLDQIFSAGTFAYTSEVNYFVNSTRVTVVRSNELATAILNTQPQSPLVDRVPSEPVDLAEGADTVLAVEVTAGDGVTVNNYTVTVSRAARDDLDTLHYLKASNSDDGDNFGFALALDDSTLVVGAPAEQSNSENSEGNNGLENAGAAYVFANSGGLWAQAAYLKASPTIAAGDLFGYSLAVDGNTIAVGAPGTNSEAGRVYLYTFAAGDWDFDASVVASDAAPGQEFGHALSLSGDYLIVGAPGRSADSGAVYVFERDGNDWEQREILSLESGQVGARFGAALQFNVGQEDLEFIAGAPEEAGGAGAAYVYQQDDNDQWSQSAAVTAGNAEAGDNFGQAVAIRFDTLAVGAPGEDSDANEVDGDADNNNEQDSGAVYVFTRDGQNDAWGDEVYFKATEDSDMALGSAVALSSGMLAVGAPREDSDATGVNGDDEDSSETDAGAVYVFARANNDWTFEVYAKASNTDAGDVFGAALVFAGDNLVVGARGEDSDSEGVDSTPNEDAADAGAVYIVR